ncbi:RNA polymerase sigma factor [Saccharopolyspora erythraea]|uniref:Uncharacterized protein n=2 Tax=Saccharopolyspora erythraea TaxID=1836 RepID=A4FI52_SACEN|nr:sigma-70 family RNA polymerase sigma factor [Saccharopolyspora erythraea]CAM03727.1 hypothetical protein SACE_4458 [Saccharopolyspora erythraea NRRL 2338]
MPRPATSRGSWPGRRAKPTTTSPRRSPGCWTRCAPAAGPTRRFRPYLLVTVRHVAYNRARKDRPLRPAEDVTTTLGVRLEAISGSFEDTAVAKLERSPALRAFARLPERWQTVLWHTVVEGESPQRLAPLLGLTPKAWPR